MSELAVGSLKGLAANDFVIDVAAGSTLNVPPPAILQVVTATDSTNRTVTSGTFTDAGISVSITPVSATSTLFVYWSGRGFSGQIGGTSTLGLQITDSSNTALEGAEEAVNSQFHEPGGGTGFNVISTTILGVVASGSTSAQTFKLRFARLDGTGLPAIQNASQTGRMMIQEVEL